MVQKHSHINAEKKKINMDDTGEYEDKHKPGDGVEGYILVYMFSDTGNQ